MKKLAIIGTGMAGMSAAYFLHKDYELTVFEKNNYVGGHTNTIDVHDGQNLCPMDTGFMVFNERTYPYMLKLFKELGVTYTDTDMGFAVDHRPSKIQYNGSSLSGLFIQKKNLFRPSHLKMIKDIIKFNKASVKLIKEDSSYDPTLEEYVRDLNLRKSFLYKFLIPMSSAVWSTPEGKMLGFPAKTLSRFFYNHGFIGVDTQFQWKTVIGGSRQYRDKITKPYSDRIIKDEPVIKVTPQGKQVAVSTNNQTYYFDKVIIAAHGDDAFKMLENPTPIQVQALCAVEYQENEITVHTDSTVMPTIKKNWRSWNYITDINKQKQLKSYTVYWMNSLQKVSHYKDFFINVNGREFIDPKHILKKMTYHHSVFTKESIAAQNLFNDLNSSGPIYFTGAYFRYGFHEDALDSTVRLLRHGFNKEVLS